MPRSTPRFAINQAIGLRIKAARLKTGLRQSDVAELLGVSRTHVTHLEGGRNNVEMTRLVEIAGYLGVSVHDLIPEGW